MAPTLVAAGSAAAMLLLQVVDPSTPGRYPTCPFLAATGCFCPGCGSLRMFHELGEADLAGAWAMNPLAVLLVPVLVGYWLQWTVRSTTDRWRGPPLPSAVVWGFLAVVVGYAVLRNLPGMEVLAPG